MELKVLVFEMSGISDAMSIVNELLPTIITLAVLGMVLRLLDKMATKLG